MSLILFTLTTIAFLLFLANYICSEKRSPHPSEAMEFNRCKEDAEDAAFALNAIAGVIGGALVLALLAVSPLLRVAAALGMLGATICFLYRRFFGPDQSGGEMIPPPPPTTGGWREANPMSAEFSRMEATRCVDCQDSGFFCHLHRTGERLVARPEAPARN